MFTFGLGAAIATPVSGNLAPNPTPIQFATLQDVSLDFSGDIKELYGQNQFPDDVARGKVKITWKAKYGRIVGKQINDVFFGQTQNPTNKAEQASLNEGPTAIPTTPFQITVVQAATFFKDLGVINAATGAPFTAVAAGPIAGQYSVNTATGVYTFAAADNVSGISVYISYSYQSAASAWPGTLFNTSHIVNQKMGFNPRFQLWLSQPYNNLQSNILLYQCMAAKFMWNGKNEDYTVPEMEGSAFADSGGNVVDFYEAQ